MLARYTIDENYDIDSDTGCWIWNRGKYGSSGYGSISADEFNQVRAHRHYYELFVGPIPDDVSILTI